MPAGQGIHCNQQLQRSKIVELVLENFPLSWHGDCVLAAKSTSEMEVQLQESTELSTENWALQCIPVQYFWHTERDAELMPDIR